MNFLFTCGGTAGHINPALAVAGILRDRMPDCGILFVGANGKMETDLVPRAGYDIVTIEVTNIHRSLKPSEIAYNFRSLHNARQATKDARKIIEDFQPDVAIGTGGYVCYPVLKAAAQLGIPTVVHESNAVPGLTTKMLAGAVDRILVGFEESKQHYSEQEKVVVTGTPVRGAFTACSKAEAKRQLGLDPQTRNQLWTHVRRLNEQEQVTVFLTTHYMEEAERVAQRIAVIDHGRIVAQDTPASLKAQTGTDSLEQAFLALTGTAIREQDADASDQMRRMAQAWRR